MTLKVVWTTKFKRDYKRAMKRGLLIYYVDGERLVLTLTRTGTHADLFGL